MEVVQIAFSLLAAMLSPNSVFMAREALLTSFASTPLVGYVLTEDSNAITLLTERDRAVVKLNKATLYGRSYCETGEDLLAWPFPRDSRYPEC